MMGLISVDGLRECVVPTGWLQRHPMGGLVLIAGQQGGDTLLVKYGKFIELLLNDCTTINQ
jgi:hypothetical protein